MPSSPRPPSSPSVVARLPLATFSIGLLVHAEHLTGSYAAAGAPAGALAIAQGTGGPLLGRLVDRRGQTVVLLGSALVAGAALATVAALPIGTPVAAAAGPGRDHRLRHPAGRGVHAHADPDAAAGRGPTAPGVRGGRRRHRTDLGRRPAARPARRRPSPVPARRSPRPAPCCVAATGLFAPPPHPAAGARRPADRPAAARSPAGHAHAGDRARSAWRALRRHRGRRHLRRGPLGRVRGAGPLLGLWGAGSCSAGSSPRASAAAPATAAASRSCWPRSASGHLTLAAAAASLIRLAAVLIAVAGSMIAPILRNLLRHGRRRRPGRHGHRGVRLAGHRHRDRHLDRRGGRRRRWPTPPVPPRRSCWPAAAARAAVVTVAARPHPVRQTRRSNVLRRSVMPYVQLGDVNTWYAEEGEGEPLVLFHPGGADSRAFEMSNLAGLAERYHTYRFDRRGHGRTADVPGPIGYQQMADDSIAFIETVVGGPAYILGPQRRRSGGPAGRPHPPGSGPPPGLLLRGVQPRGLAARGPGPGRRDGRVPQRLVRRGLPGRQGALGRGVRQAAPDAPGRAHPHPETTWPGSRHRRC